MSAQQLGRDLHYLGVRGDLPSIAAKLTEMGWVKMSDGGPSNVISTPGAIVVNGLDGDAVALAIADQVGRAITPAHVDLVRGR
ncbi:hypothetical protein SEA_MASHLEY_63 [Microbacterium phage Mashley]|uniref:Uncharacterized protein n=1 Tax=Microbacterium phage Hyperion TaxID=2182354 RepID=A0A2U8UJ03_9CAUD|nr:hypothetical protein HOT27_gp063 [Microbacterium phage Hyperion]AWN03578.1 hypothetical protein PBI_HYPERION_63 [Microbacterium phage Hyperion]QED11879.1 hypothetical protein SEA_MASHLEY_63 [Microbacterium phage Mashley]UVG34431.1 hypothetical protein SEA_GAZEBO_62 [Microbacterium phage Gazebo]